MFNYDFYYEIYNALYARNYHKWQCTTQAKGVCELILNHEPLSAAQTILDVGCAKGWALQHLQEHGRGVAGIDISERAIKFLKEQDFECCLASAMDIPYEDSSFDLVMSTDVFEHLLPTDVEQAISECYRVASRYLVLQIHTGKSRIRFAAGQWAKSKGLNTLHLTIKPTKWWIEQFTNDRAAEVIFQQGSVFAIEIKRPRQESNL